MKVLTALGLILLVGIAIFVGMPILAAAVGLAISLGCLFIWLLPFLIIATSDKTTGGEKAAWLLAMIFLSWFAWIFYWLLAPLKPRDDDRRYASRHSRARFDRYDRFDRDHRGRGYY